MQTKVSSSRIRIIGSEANGSNVCYVDYKAASDHPKFIGDAIAARLTKFLSTKSFSNADSFYGIDAKLFALVTFCCLISICLVLQQMEKIGI